MQTLFLDFETLQFGTQSKNSNINYKVYAHLCIWQLEKDILQWNLIALWCIEIWYHRRRCGNLWFLCWPFALFISSSRVGYHYGFYGFPGLFLAAICAHSLSIISTGFNAISQGLWVQLFVRVSSFITK